MDAITCSTSLWLDIDANKLSFARAFFNLPWGHCLQDWTCMCRLKSKIVSPLFWGTSIWLYVYQISCVNHMAANILGKVFCEAVLLLPGVNLQNAPEWGCYGSIKGTKLVSGQNQMSSANIKVFCWILHLRTTCILWEYLRLVKRCQIGGRQHLMPNWPPALLFLNSWIFSVLRHQLCSITSQGKLAEKKSGSQKIWLRSRESSPPALYCYSNWGILRKTCSVWNMKVKKSDHVHTSHLLIHLLTRTHCQIIL